MHNNVLKPCLVAYTDKPELSINQSPYHSVQWTYDSASCALCSVPLHGCGWDMCRSFLNAWNNVLSVPVGAGYLSSRIGVSTAAKELVACVDRLCENGRCAMHRNHALGWNVGCGGTMTLCIRTEAYVAGCTSSPWHDAPVFATSCKQGYILAAHPQVRHK